MFMITEKAAEKFQESLSQIGDTGLFLRVAARYHSEQGMVYNMGFDRPQQEDITYQISGLEVCLDAETDTNITGMMIDFGEHEGVEQFIFLNPQDAEKNNPDTCGTTKGSAGCGSGGCSCG